MIGLGSGAAFSPGSTAKRGCPVRPRQAVAYEIRDWPRERGQPPAPGHTLIAVIPAILKGFAVPLRLMSTVSTSRARPHPELIEDFGSWCVNVDTANPQRDVLDHALLIRPARRLIGADDLDDANPRVEALTAGLMSSR